MLWYDTGEDSSLWRNGLRSYSVLLKAELEIVEETNEALVMTSLRGKIGYFCVLNLKLQPDQFLPSWCLKLGAR